MLFYPPMDKERGVFLVPGGDTVFIVVWHIREILKLKAK